MIWHKKTTDSNSICQPFRYPLDPTAEKAGNHFNVMIETWIFRLDHCTHHKYIYALKGQEHSKEAAAAAVPSVVSTSAAVPAVSAIIHPTQNFPRLEGYRIQRLDKALEDLSFDLASPGRDAGCLLGIRGCTAHEFDLLEGGKEEMLGSRSNRVKRKQIRWTKDLRIRRGFQILPL